METYVVQYHSYVSIPFIYEIDCIFYRRNLVCTLKIGPIHASGRKRVTLPTEYIAYRPVYKWNIWYCTLVNNQLTTCNQLFILSLHVIISIVPCRRSRKELQFCSKLVCLSVHPSIRQISCHTFLCLKLLIDIWFYHDQLHICLIFCFDLMILCRVMALGCPQIIHIRFIMLEDIDLVFIKYCIPS